MPPFPDAFPNTPLTDIQQAIFYVKLRDKLVPADDGVIGANGEAPSAQQRVEKMIEDRMLPKTPASPETNTTAAPGERATLKQEARALERELRAFFDEKDRKITPLGLAEFRDGGGLAQFRDAPAVIDFFGKTQSKTQVVFGLMLDAYSNATSILAKREDDAADKPVVGKVTIHERDGDGAPSAPIEVSIRAQDGNGAAVPATAENVAIPVQDGNVAGNGDAAHPDDQRPITVRGLAHRTRAPKPVGSATR